MYYSSTIMGGQVCLSSNDIPGKIVIVTGGNGGIGYEICRELCVRKAVVIMACRDLVKGRAAILKIKQICSWAKIEARELDMASFSSVKAFASNIRRDFVNVDALVNNAGVIFQSEQRTIDGFEPHLQVNYLSAILLTELLRNVLQSNDGGRVVFTSAQAYETATVDSANPLNVEPDAKQLHARELFAHSKALLVMWTHVMGKLTDNNKLQVLAYTPGFVRGTNHLKK